MALGWPHFAFNMVLAVLPNSRWLGKRNVYVWKWLWPTFNLALCACLSWSCPKLACIFKVIQKLPFFKRMKKDEDNNSKPAAECPPRVERFAFSLATVLLVNLAVWGILYLATESHELEHCPVEFTGTPFTPQMRRLGVAPGVNQQALCVFGASEPEYRILFGEEHDFRLANITLDQQLGTVLARIPQQPLYLQVDYTCSFMWFTCQIEFRSDGKVREEKIYRANTAQRPRSGLVEHPIASALAFVVILVLLFACTLCIACIFALLCSCALAKEIVIRHAEL